MFLLATATVVVASTANKGGPGRGNGPQLITLLDDVAVPSGQSLTIESNYGEVSGFSEWRVFSRTTSLSDGGRMLFTMIESVDGMVDSLLPTQQIFIYPLSGGS